MAEGRLEPERYELLENPAYSFAVDRRAFFKVLGAGLVVLGIRAGRARPRRPRSELGVRASDVAELDAIARRPDATHLAALRAAAADPDPALAARKARLERLLTIRFDPDPQARIAAIEGFSGDTGADLQAVLNPLLATTRIAAPAIPGEAPGST